MISNLSFFIQLGPIVESRNAQFLKYQVFYDMDQRMVTDVALPDSAINDGDFLGIIRLDGLDPMLAWAMGAHTGELEANEEGCNCVLCRSKIFGTPSNSGS